MPHTQQPPEDPGTDPLEEIMAGCLEVPDEEQGAALSAACAAHPELADALRARFATLSAMGMVCGTPAPMPERLGDFRLVRRLGSGGMGVIYLAVQESLGREVALKLIRPEHLWFREHRARFRRECEAVARMRHPGIVPIHTVGEEDGVPYYAMEYVHGRTLAEIVRDLQGRDPGELGGELLGLPAGTGWVAGCFEVARQVAVSLQHAHERGVIHRDVKPSNVMLAAGGRAMLLDFGLAAREGVDQLTRTGSNPGSLSYMSPEQLRGEKLDARTDVYSLGVTLYELLTLHAPYRAPHEQDVRSRILAAAPAPIRSLNRAVPWDADTVCRTAFAPERARRYPTAAAFAEDLAAFLGHRPIAARRAGTLLRLRRFAQRRPALTTGLALGVLLVGGTPTALLLNEHAARVAIAHERDVAEIKAETARRVTTFMVELFHEASPERSRGATIPVRLILERGIRRIRDELGGEPAVRAELMESLGQVVMNLGLYAEAEPLLRGALQLRRELERPDREIAEAESRLGTLLLFKGDAKEAEPLHRHALALHERMRPAVPKDLANAMLDLGQTCKRTGDDAEARRMFEGAYALLRGLRPPEPAAEANALGMLAAYLEDLDDYRKAEPLFREALAILDRAVAGDHPAKALWLMSLGITLRSKADFAAAEHCFDETLRMARLLYDPDHPLLAEAKETYAELLVMRGELGRAQALLDEARESFARSYPRDHPLRLRALSLAGNVHLRRGEYAAAGAVAAEAVAMGRRINPEGHVDLAIVLSNLGLTRLYQGALEGALEAARESVAMHRALRHGKLDSLGAALRNLAQVLAGCGSAKEAEEVAREGLRVLREYHRADHPDVAEMLLQLTNVLLTAGNGADAEPLVHEATELLERLGQASPDALRLPHHLLGWSRHLQGDLAGARRIQAEALASYRASLAPGHPLLAFPLNELGVVEAKLKDLARAEELLAEAVRVRRAALDPSSPQLSMSLLNLASVLNLRGRPAEALPLAWECLDALTKGGGSPRVKEGCVKLLLRVLALPPGPGQVGTPDVPRLEAAARALLPAGHALLTEVSALSARAASRPDGGSRPSRPADR